MKLSKAYRLAPEDAHRVRMKMGKGCFVLGCLIPVGIIASLFARGFFPPAGRWMIDLAIVLVILMIFQLFLKEGAHVRLEIGREHASSGNNAGVVAALEPFAYAGSRMFDRTGEANYLLGHAAKQLGEENFAEHCLRYAAKAKQSEWADKARELLS